MGLSLSLCVCVCVSKAGTLMAEGISGFDAIPGLTNLASVTWQMLAWFFSSDLLLI